MIERRQTQSLNPDVRVQTLDPCVTSQRGYPGASLLASALPLVIRGMQLQEVCQVLSLWVKRRCP